MKTTKYKKYLLWALELSEFINFDEYSNTNIETIRTILDIKVYELVKLNKRLIWLLLISKKVFDISEGVTLKSAAKIIR